MEVASKEPPGFSPWLMGEGQDSHTKSAASLGS